MHHANNVEAITTITSTDQSKELAAQIYKDAESGFWTQLGSGSLSKIASEGLVGSGLLPGLDVIGKEIMDALPKLDLKGMFEKMKEAQVDRAADIIASGDDFGSDTQRNELQKMFEAAREKGPEAVKELVDSINTELKERGSKCHLEYGPEIVDFESGKFGKNDVLRLVNEHRQIEDKILIAKEGFLPNLYNLQKNSTSD